MTNAFPRTRGTRRPIVVVPDDLDPMPRGFRMMAAGFRAAGYGDLERLWIRMAEILEGAPFNPDENTSRLGERMARQRRVGRGKVDPLTLQIELTKKPVTRLTAEEESHREAFREATQ